MTIEKCIITIATELGYKYEYDYLFSDFEQEPDDHTSVVFVERVNISGGLYDSLHSQMDRSDIDIEVDHENIGRLQQPRSDMENVETP